MKRISVLFLTLIAMLSAYAANVKVSGVVVSATDNEPLIGASVLVQGMSTGVSTDIEGRFVTEVPAGSTLVFRYVGCQEQQLKVTGPMTDITVVMKEDSQMLDDVVVIGYGVQKKSVVTASIAKISADDLGQVNPVRVDDALKGLAAGINVTSNNGQPGAGSTIRVRGIGTINNSDPLYIVDGMPVDDGIGFLDPNDIASIEVLKDAASGAVYGARAANGVILVTTKKVSIRKKPT